MCVFMCVFMYMCVYVRCVCMYVCVCELCVYVCVCVCEVCVLKRRDSVQLLQLNYFSPCNFFLELSSWYLSTN